MQRVKCVWRNLVVELGRRHAHRRERREIIAVDQVVRDARMVRLLFRLLVQDPGCFELLREILVVEVDSSVEREGVEDCRLGVLRVVLVQALHRLLIALGAGLMVDLVVILVKDLDRREVFGLARRLGVRGLALLDRLPPGFEIGGREGRHQRVGQFAHRQTPIGDGAPRIFLNQA